MKHHVYMIAICMGTLLPAVPALADVTNLNFIAAATGRDRGPQDGRFDELTELNLGSVNNNGFTSFQTAFEFNLSGLPSDATINSAQLVMDLSNFEGKRTIEVHGYTGDGTVQLPDFARSGLLATANVSPTGTQHFTLDVTSFVASLAAKGETFAGFTVREEPANKSNFVVMRLARVGIGFLPQLSIAFSSEQTADIDIKPGSVPNSMLGQSSPADPTDANSLLADCIQAVKIMDGDKKLGESASTDALRCVVYIKGFRGGQSTAIATAAFKMYGQQAARKRDNLRINCADDPRVTNGQIVRAVVQYLQQHAEQLHLPAELLVNAALANAFRIPCKHSSPADPTTGAFSSEQTADIDIKPGSVSPTPNRGNRMFIWLLVVTLAVSAVVCFVANKLFDKPIGNILSRLVSEELGSAWQRYITFAIYVVGISGGVRIWALERYVTRSKGARVVELTDVRWVLEVYRTIIETLQGITWVLLVFFVIALIAYVILRGFELKQKMTPSRTLRGTRQKVARR